MRYCPNCGQPLEEGTNFCRSCGYGVAPAPTQAPQQANQVNYAQPVMPQPAYAPVYAQPQSGKGLAIASLVLGIISVIWSLLTLASFSQVEDELIKVLETTELSEMAAKISYGIGFVLIITVTGVLALIFGLKRKNFGLGKAGIILASISLLVAVISFIYVLSISI